MLLMLFVHFFLSNFHSYLFSYYYLHHFHILLFLFYHLYISHALTSHFLLRLQHYDCVIIYDHLTLNNLCDLYDFYDETMIKLWNSSFKNLFWLEFQVHDIICFKDMLAQTQKSSSKQDLIFFRIKSINYLSTDSFVCLNR